MPSATTVSRFDSARLSSRIRSPSNTVAGSSGAPLRTTSSTFAAASSMNVDAPGSTQVKMTAVDVRKVSWPVVRSSSTS